MNQIPKWYKLGDTGYKNQDHALSSILFSTDHERLGYIILENGDMILNVDSKDYLFHTPNEIDMTNPMFDMVESPHDENLKFEKLGKISGCYFIHPDRVEEEHRKKFVIQPRTSYDMDVRPREYNCSIFCFAGSPRYFYLIFTIIFVDDVPVDAFWRTKIQGDDLFECDSIYFYLDINSSDRHDRWVSSSRSP